MLQFHPGLPECLITSERFLKLNRNRADTCQEDSFSECNGNIMQKNIVIEEIDTISKQICKNWILIQNSLYDESNVSIECLSRSRNQINSLFSVITTNLAYAQGTQFSKKYIDDTVPKLKKCAAIILPMCSMDHHTSTRLACALMKSSRCPIYIYFHTFLDIQHYFLMLSNLCGYSLEEIENLLRQVMKDLIWYCHMLYINIGSSTEVFSCCCSKSFWLSLQIFVNNTFASLEVFWKQFNIVAASEDPVFILWILKDIALLYQMSVEEIIEPVSNFSLIESSLKQITYNSSINCLGSCLDYMQPLLTDVWLKSSQIEVYQILWDYFSKRINYEFFNIDVYCGNAASFSELIDTILWCPKDCEGDFLKFVSFLIRHLEAHPHHWSKIKGRIYSQLNPHKIKDLNKYGLFNVMLLYNSLMVINPNEVTKKIISAIEPLPSDKKHTEMLWNILIAFMLRQVKDGKSISSISPLMEKMLQEASDDSTKFWLVKIFITGFQTIIENSRHMQLQQCTLINSWISKYLLTCNYKDLNDTLLVLINIIDRVKEENIWPEWELVFKETVYPSLKQITNSPTSPAVIGKLGAKLSHLSPALCTELFSFFNSEHMSASISSEYLCELLEDYPNNCMLSSHQEDMALQTWIKMCILTVGNYEKLTRNVIKLDSFLQTIKSKLIESEDPFVSFVEHLGCNAREYSQSPAVLKLCETCFGQADRWISQYFIQPDNEQVVMRAYVSVATMFTHCAVLLYDRNKATCPLARLITSLLLPTEFMVGRNLHPFILNGVKSTWHYFVLSIVKLNRASDYYLDRTLRDLVVKYLPYLSSSDSPIIKCLDDNEAARTVLDKLSLAFFKYPTKELDANVLKALKLINEYILGTTSVDSLKLIVKKCLPNIFEIIMFHNQRNTAISLLKNITSTHLYIHAKSDVEEAIVIVGEKHMAFNTIPFFQLMNVLAKFIPRDLQSVTYRLEKCLSNIEKMRGVGSDKILRGHFEKLQNTIQQSL